MLTVKLNCTHAKAHVGQIIVGVTLKLLLFTSKKKKNKKKIMKKKTENEKNSKRTWKTKPDTVNDIKAKGVKQ